MRPSAPEEDDTGDPDDHDKTPICHMTGSYCTGLFCTDYGCAKEAGFDDEPDL